MLGLLIDWIVHYLEWGSWAVYEKRQIVSGLVGNLKGYLTGAILKKLFFFLLKIKKIKSGKIFFLINVWGGKKTKQNLLDRTPLNKIVTGSRIQRDRQNWNLTCKQTNQVTSQLDGIEPNLNIIAYVQSWWIWNLAIQIACKAA